MLKMKNVFYRDCALMHCAGRCVGGTQRERRDKDKFLGKGSQ